MIKSIIYILSKIEHKPTMRKQLNDTSIRSIPQNKENT